MPKYIIYVYQDDDDDYYNNNNNYFLPLQTEYQCIVQDNYIEITNNFYLWGMTISIMLCTFLLMIITFSLLMVVCVCCNGWCGFSITACCKACES